jgi:hypothetical protein
MYISTIMSILDHLPSKKYSHTVVQKQVTYCDWTDSKMHPKTFDTFPGHLVDEGRRNGAVLLRKCKTSGSNLDSWLQKLYVGSSLSDLNDAVSRVAAAIESIPNTDTDRISPSKKPRFAAPNPENPFRRQCFTKTYNDSDSRTRDYKRSADESDYHGGKRKK